MPLTPEEIEALEEVFSTIGDSFSQQSEDENDAKEIFKEEMKRHSGGVETLDSPPKVYKVDKEDISQWATPYDRAYGVDGGTTRPEAYDNGVVLDVAKARAAMLGEGDENIERSTTIVAAVFAEEGSVERRVIRDDDVRSEIITIDPSSRHIRQEVSARAQKLAEGSHANRIAGLDGPLFLDGSIYPQSIMSGLLFAKEQAHRTGGASGLPRSAGKKQDMNIVNNYVNVVDKQMESDNPLIGVVKTMTTEELVSAIEDKRLQRMDNPSIPWRSDAQFMSNVLHVNDPGDVTFTSWMVKTAMKDSGKDVEPLLGFDTNDNREPRDYRRAFFYARLPSKGIVFRIESPLMMVKEESERVKIQRYVLKKLIDSDGPPAVIERADSRAHISRNNAHYLKQALEKKMKQTQDYNLHVRFNHIRHEGDNNE